MMLEKLEILSMNQITTYGNSNENANAEQNVLPHNGYFPINAFCFLFINFPYQTLGCTTEMNLSTATKTVDQMDPLREICIMGSSQGSRKGW